MKIIKKGENWCAPTFTEVMVECNNCGNLVQSHHVCPKCGFYRGRQVITPETKA